MGGDFAIQKTVHGAILALKELPNDTSIEQAVIGAIITYPKKYDDVHHLLDLS